MEQSSFDFPFLDRYLDSEFLVVPENSKAFKFISTYDSANKDLPKIFAIYGRHGSGKTHLAHIWQRKMQANFLNPDHLIEAEIAIHIEKNQNYIIENIENMRNQTALFHIFNIALEKNCSLLLTADKNPTLIKYHLEDLASRLKNIFAIEIKNPENDLMKMLLVKQFSAKQLKINDKIIDYLAGNLDRSYEKIEQITKLLEFYSIERKQKITQKFVKELLLKNL